MSLPYSFFWYEFSLIFHYAYHTDNSLLPTERSSCMSLVLKVRVDFRNSPFSQRPQGTYLPPKFWITIVANFPWVLSRPQRNRRQPYAFFSGGGGGGKKFYHIVLLFFRTIARAASPPTTCSRFRKSLEIYERTDAKNGLLQWYGHPSVLGISISKTRVIQASPSHITRRFGLGVALQGRDLRVGMPISLWQRL